ncbi:MAG: FliH/SctL family protein [Clostridia bacterium]|nr:FliH/SctL family protein [Clostridia bacterium]
MSSVIKCTYVSVDNEDALDLSAERVEEVIMTKDEMVVDAAHKEAEEIRKRAYEEGYAKGEIEAEKLRLKAEGYMLQAQNELDTVLEEKKQILIETELEVVDLIKNVCSNLLGSEVMNYDEKIIALTKCSLSNMIGKKNIKVRVSDKDYGILAENLNVLKEELIGVDFELVKDPSLADESCIIDTEFGSMDYSIKSQLETLYQKMDSETIKN